ncbi:unnamed protein product, partial [Medioppia subpectinata]
MNLWLQLRDYVRGQFFDVGYIQVMYTSVLLLSHLTFYMKYALIGPAFVDFKYILNTSLETITRIPTLYTGGIIVGTLLGLLHRYVNRQITIIIVLVVMNVFNTAMPYSQHVWQLYACAAVLGVTAGAWLTAYNVWLIEIWQEKAVRVLLFSQLMHGIGQFAGEQLARPYLTGHPPDAYNSTVNDMYGEYSPDERRAKLVVPFLIGAVVHGIGPLLLIIMYITKPYVKVKQYYTVETSTDRDARQAAAPTLAVTARPRLVTRALVCLSLGTIHSIDSLIPDFAVTYLQYIPARLSASRAASVTSAISGTYTVAHLVELVATYAFTTSQIIHTHFAIACVAFVALAFVGHNETLVWISSVAVGFGVSILFPALLAFYGSVVVVSDRMATAIWLSWGAVYFAPSLVLGHYIESTPYVFVVIALALIS